MMAFFKYKNWWIWNSDWFQHWFHEPVPMSLYGTWPISLLSVRLSLRFFLLKIGLISTYKMPPCLPSYLIRALRYSSRNIRKFGILHNGHLADMELHVHMQMRWKWHHYQQFKPHPWRLIMSKLASMENLAKIWIFPLKLLSALIR